MAQIDLSKVKIAGSAEEVRELGLDTRSILTCGPGGHGVAACPLYDVCERQEKRKTGFVTWTKDGEQVKSGPGPEAVKALEGAVREGPGPLNLGVRRSKRIGPGKFKVINATMACWEYPHQKRQWLAQNVAGDEPRAICQIVAIEGQVINLPGSLPTPTEDGKIIHIMQRGGIPTVIKPFVRPRDNEAFAASAMAVAELNREEEIRQRSDLKDFVKLAPHQTGGGLEMLDNEGTDPKPRAGTGGASSRG